MTKIGSFYIKLITNFKNKDLIVNRNFVWYTKNKIDSKIRLSVSISKLLDQLENSTDIFRINKGYETNTIVIQKLKLSNKLYFDIERYRSLDNLLSYKDNSFDKIIKLFVESSDIIDIKLSNNKTYIIQFDDNKYLFTHNTDEKQFYIINSKINIFDIVEKTYKLKGEINEHSND